MAVKFERDQFHKDFNRRNFSPIFYSFKNRIVHNQRVITPENSLALHFSSGCCCDYASLTVGATATPTA